VKRPWAAAGNRGYRALPDRAAFFIERAQNDAKWTDRTGEDSAPVLFSVVPSLCFHTVFLAKRTDWTDVTGITAGCSGRTAAPGIFRVSHTMLQRQGMQPRIANPALSQSQQFQRADRAICVTPHRSIALTIARKPPTDRVYFAVSGHAEAIRLQRVRPQVKFRQARSIALFAR
jgi:hypothetical protein